MNCSSRQVDFSYTLSAMLILLLCMARRDDDPGTQLHLCCGTAPESRKPAPEITAAMVDALGDEVLRIEATPGILNDWSVPGELPGSAAFDVARTVCRRVERLAVAQHEAGELPNLHILAYLNRLSDLLWLIGRLLELRAGADAALRPKDQPGPRWSRAW